MAYDTIGSAGEGSQFPMDPSNDPPPLYSVFSIPQKRIIVFLTAYTSMFSPISSFIYYPALTSIASSLHVSIELINLTITSYLIVAGIAPTLLGDMADMIGRRPIYLSILLIYIGANVGLALQSSYTALLVLRMVQSFGASATIAIAYGIISDIATPAERGTYTGMVFLGPNMGPLLGPVVGGLIAGHLGWRWIFWFLTIIATFCFILLLFLLPETSRKIVGNGSIAASGIHETLLSVIWPGKKSTPAAGFIPEEWIFQIPNPLTSLYTIFHKNAALIMLCHATYYMTYSCIQASMSSLLIEVYNLSPSQAGFTYLPAGIGCTMGTYLSGKMMNRDYRLTAKEHNFTIDELRGDDLSNFPIEQARLRSARILAPLAILCILGYGWSVDRHLIRATFLGKHSSKSDGQQNIAIPLCIQFLMGGTFVVLFNSISTLLVDLHPSNPATAQAGLNIVRCSLSAAGLAVLQIALDGLGPGWCFTVFSGVMAGTLPLIWVVRECGMGWRVGKGEGRVGEEEPLLGS